MITHADDSSFNHFVVAASHGIPVIVDFGASWCGPCKALHPILQRLDVDLQGRAQVVMVDIDQASHTSIALGIKSVPTLLLYKAGKIVSRYTGNPGSVQAILSLFGPEIGV
jgi:thioredoxin 1